MLDKGLLGINFASGVSWAIAGFHISPCPQPSPERVRQADLPHGEREYEGTSWNDKSVVVV